MAHDDVDYAAIVKLFEEKNWQWNLGGEKKVPNLADIKGNVQKMHSILEASNELESQITVGHLIMQRDYDFYYLFVHAGTIDAS